MPLTPPRQLSPEAIAERCAEAKARFRELRLGEPRDIYLKAFREYRPSVATVLSALPRLLADPVSVEQMAEVFRDPRQRAAFRYLAAPPVSEDDLMNVADVKLSQAGLRQPGAAQAVSDTVRQVLDVHRFPWVPAGRAATRAEVRAALLATTAMLATQAVQTARRNEAKQDQEGAVRDVLKRAGYREVQAPREIRPTDDGLEAGTFCAETRFGQDKADVLARLWDRRHMPIECKVSNSSVNSEKRLNKEAAGKAARWLAAFGNERVVPAAVLAGVFAPSRVALAQRAGLAIFWAHRLDELSDFVTTAR